MGGFTRVVGAGGTGTPGRRHYPELDAEGGSGYDMAVADVTQVVPNREQLPGALFAY